MSEQKANEWLAHVREAKAQALRATAELGRLLSSPPPGAEPLLALRSEAGLPAAQGATQSQVAIAASAFAAPLVRAAEAMAARMGFVLSNAESSLARLAASDGEDALVAIPARADRARVDSVGRVVAVPAAAALEAGIACPEGGWPFLGTLGRAAALALEADGQMPAWATAAGAAELTARVAAVQQSAHKKQAEDELVLREHLREKAALAQRASKTPAELELAELRQRLAKLETERKGDVR